ncbi:MAG: Uma2 family endonuclease [Lachnospiraceae bacterium]|nr:Uma2 family endonuclease [Lachnospiraceae bacterium]
MVVFTANIAYNKTKNVGVEDGGLKKEELHTVDDIYALPEGERAELIDGKIYYMAPPSRTHQKLSWKLHQTIANYIDSKDGKCEVYAAPFAVFLNNDDINYIEPDISVICDLSKLDEKGCHGAPDWIIEIVSPGNKPMDYFTKLFKYRKANVREYWIVDPTKEQIMVYRFEMETMEQYSFAEDVPVGIYDDFSICIQQFQVEVY